MNGNSEDPDIGDVQVPCWVPPTRAKDMLGLTSYIIRDLLANGSAEELRDNYGITPAEATKSLNYVELAELRAWGTDEMIEAALTGQSSTNEALHRRIVLAMKAEAAPDHMHPADAILLLERSGLMLVHELRAAVVANVGRADFVDGAGESLEDWNRMLRLAGKPSLSNELAKAWLADDDCTATAARASSITEKHQPKASLQDRAILDWLIENNLEPSRLPLRATGKSGPKAECRAQMVKAAALFSAKSFDIAWERLRKSGEIAGGN
jgi:hypothetical protein